MGRKKMKITAMITVAVSDCGPKKQKKPVAQDKKMGNINNGQIP